MLQFVTLAVAEKISALATVELMARRTAGAPDRSRFEELLRRAPDVDPDEGDKL
jgi:hypothetical protein